MMHLKKGTVLVVVDNDTKHPSLVLGSKHKVDSYSYKGSDAFNTDTGWYVRHGKNILYVDAGDSVLAILEQPDT